MLSRRNPASALPTTSSRAARCSEFPMRGLWKLRLMKISSYPAWDATIPYCLRFFSCSGANSLLSPGFRNEFHAGLGQAFGKHFVIDAEYIWKYTHNAYDFSVLGNTPITFPIEWHNSKIPGFAPASRRDELPRIHGVRGHVERRSPFLHAADRRGRRRSRRGFGFPHRPRRALQPDDPPAIPALAERAMAWVQLAVRQWSCGRTRTLRRRQLRQRSRVATDTTIVDVSGLSADQQSEAGLFCGSVHAVAAHRRQI